MAFTSALHEISTALCNCAVAAFASCPTVLQLASGEPMALPQELAVDRPVKLGATLNGNTTDGFLTFRYDFQPDSMQRVAQGDLLFFGKEQEKIKFIPELPEGDAPFHYDGPCTTLQQQEGEDTECVAIFNGTEWVLELVSARISAKHVRGTPQIPGYNVDVEEEPGSQPTAEQTGAQTAAPAAAFDGQAAADDDIDPDLNDALDEALFAVDNHTEEPAAQQHPAAASPPARTQQHQQSLHQAVQQLSVQRVVPQQPTQQQQQPAQQHEEEEEDPDDPWAEYGDAVAAPQAAAPTAAPSQPPAAPAPAPAATAPAPAAAAAAAAAGVRVVSHEEGQDEEDDDDEEAVHACSDDESDGLGVEVF